MVGVFGGGWSLVLGVECDVVKSVVVLRCGWLVFLGRVEPGVGCRGDVIKSVVVLRHGWLVLWRRMESGVGCGVECC